MAFLRDEAPNFAAAAVNHTPIGGMPESLVCHYLPLGEDVLSRFTCFAQLIGAGREIGRKDTVIFIRNLVSNQPADVKPLRDSLRYRCGEVRLFRNHELIV